MTVKKQGDFGILRDDLHGTTNEPTYAGVTSFMRRKYTRDLDGCLLYTSDAADEYQRV